jgi:predicted membrane-bound mannosyltransferase/DNA-binding beta-propeller fold protein YncE
MNHRTFSRPVFEVIPWLTWEVLFFAVLLSIAAMTRFLYLGDRAMSHDESLHTYYSWRYAEGFGYQHNPMMHGPFQFHILAATYYLFDASDFTSRIPAALFSLATIWMVWYWQRFIGKWGALFAGVMLVFSPYMLFYGRYARNEAFVGLFAIVMLYAILRYFESGWHRYLYLIVLSIIFHLITKETSYIYIGLLLIFLAGYLVVKVTERPWENKVAYRGFILSLATGLLLLGAAASIMLVSTNQPAVNPATIVPADPNLQAPVAAATSTNSLSMIVSIIGLGALGFSIYFLFSGFGLSKIRELRSFDLLMLVSTLVLPTLSAPLTKIFGGNPLDYSSAGLARSASFIVPLVVISIGLGLWWNKRIYAISALAFWGIFITFYTSLFSHPSGFFSGLIGSLGYWLEQQPVERGSQPLYYYLLIQIPVYEFLPALGAVIGMFYGFKHKSSSSSETTETSFVESNYKNTFSLLTYWTIACIIAFTFAGERMPWLTYHITLPMILLGGWGIGQLVEHIDWQGLKQRHVFIAVSSMVIFLLGALSVLFIVLGANPPFQGKDLENLQATGVFLLSVLGMAAGAVGLWILLKEWKFANIFRLGVLTFATIFLALTISTSLRANFQTFDEGREYLVYAHGASGVKNILGQLEEISLRTTGSPRNIEVAYDDDTAWPLTWYLRDYPNQHYYGAQPGKELSNVPVIIVGDNNYAAIEPVVRENYYRQDFIRMVWPNMDYFNLTPDRIKNALLNRDIRAGLMSIWLQRDFLPYANALAKNNPGASTNGYTEAEWSPADRMRLYIRKDIAGQIWEYGSSPVVEIPPDPYEGSKIELAPDITVGSIGTEIGQFDAPRGLAIASDGTLYVADSRNHRIQHFSPDGSPLGSWGTFADVNQGDAPLGTFNEPWGVAVADDGSVFVSDTWNHRIQKFAPDGNPIKSWGVFGQSSDINGFYGPRGISISPDGKVYIADTGNNRIVIYDQDGNYISQFGGPGVDVGQFSEPVDVFVSGDGLIYVTDTWNQRVQVFAPSADLSEFLPVSSWLITGWYGGSNENKPFITVDQTGWVYITDPEGHRVIVFESNAGNFVHTWGSYGSEAGQFNLPTGIVSDAQGHIWVSDSGNNRILRFSPPGQ